MPPRYKKWLFVFFCAALLALLPMVAYADFPERYYYIYCDKINGYTTYIIVDFMWRDDTYHWPAYECTACRRSADFGYKEVHSATMEATCTSHKICAVCNHLMQKALGHDTACAISGSTPITCTSVGYCARCSSSYGVPLGHDHTVTGTSYTGKAATCTGKAVCGRCGEEYGDMLGHDEVSHTAKAPTCTAIGWDAYVTCTRCDYTTYVEKAALGHDEVSHTAKAPSCTAIGWDAYVTCSRCDYTTYVEKAALGHDDSGADATCTTDEICARSGCNAVLNPAFGHSYQATVTKPICHRRGYTTHVCATCGDTYTDSYTSALAHWYDLWTDNGNGTHSASCRRYGCKYISTTECAAYTVNVGDNILDICRVCGKLGEKQLLAFERATIKLVDKNAIPGRGELIVRGLELPFDGVLYALTVAHEFATQIDPYTGFVRVTIPLELADAFHLVRVDVTEETETAERTEVWTEIVFTYENGELTFDTNKAGLFLLLPIE